MVAYSVSEKEEVVAYMCRCTRAVAHFPSFKEKLGGQILSPCRKREVYSNLGVCVTKVCLTASPTHCRIARVDFRLERLS